MEEKQATFFQHLEELRKVIIVCLLAAFAGTVASYVFLRDLLMMLVFGPLRGLDQELVMIGVTEGFFVQLKLAFLGGVVLAGPVILWQVLGFVLPALYGSERKAFWAVFLAAAALFTAGLIFGYACVLDVGLRVLLLQFSEGLTPLLSAGMYLSFVFSLLLPCGLIFEIPLAVYVLSKAGLVSARSMKKKRGYVVLAVFILAAFFSPGGDVVTQLILALPMLVLFEISVFIAVLIEKRKFAPATGE